MIDPNGPAVGGGLFGLPFSTQNARLVVIAAPFDATTSYRSGTSKGPDALLEVSQQVDLHLHGFSDFWREGLAMDTDTGSLHRLNEETRALVREARLEERPEIRQKLVGRVNEFCEQMNSWVRSKATSYLKQNKFVALVGGDHSTPLAHIEECHRKYPKLGILHIDAHADLRQAYEDFTYSHASIMYNVVTRVKPAKLVQVGIRDYCDEELSFAKAHKEIVWYRDADLFEHKARGKSWHELSQKIIGELPEEVYISFDIDGLDPSFCPGTGTPVPGGLSYNEAAYLLKSLWASGKRIVGFDLNEVGPDEWDGNVGARLLYTMIGCALTRPPARS